MVFFWVSAGVGEQGNPRERDSVRGCSYGLTSIVCTIVTPNASIIQFAETLGTRPCNKLNSASLPGKSCIPATFHVGFLLLERKGAVLLRVSVHNEAACRGIIIATTAFPLRHYA